MPASLLLKVENLHKHYGGVRAVDGVSFEMGEREGIFIIGPNGAGKTTLVNLLSGYLKPDRGSIVFKGRNVEGMSLAERARMGITRSFQLVTIFENLTVAENIAVAIASRLKRSWVLYKKLDSYRDVVEEVEELLKLFNLTHIASSYPIEISQGDRKILDVALTFALRPSLIMLDEPTSGVSSRDKYVVMDRLFMALEKAGIAFIVVEHDMDIVSKYAKRVMVMYEGRILADGAPENVMSRDDVRRIMIGGVYA